MWSSVVEYWREWLIVAILQTILLACGCAFLSLVAKALV